MGAVQLWGECAMMDRVFCFRPVKGFPKEVRTKHSAQVREKTFPSSRTVKQGSKLMNKMSLWRTQWNLDTYFVEYGCSRSIFNRRWRRKGKDRESGKMTFYFPWVLWFQTLIKKMSPTPVVLVLYNPNTGSNPNIGCLNLLSIMPHVFSSWDGFACQRCILWLTMTSVMQASRLL